MNNYLLSFLAGIAITILGYFIIQPNEKIEQLDTSYYDNLLLDKQNKIDSLFNYTDSIIANFPAIDSSFEKTKETIENHYEEVDTITNSDSLINDIKRTIQSGRIKAD